MDVQSRHPLDEQVQAGLRGDFARGQQLADELQQTSPACNRAAFNRAWYEMRKGDLLGGLDLLDRGRWEGVFGSPPLRTNKPIYRDGGLRGKHILFRSEGGLGDQIINVRFAEDFARLGAKVTVAADRSLLSTFARLPFVAAAVTDAAAPEVHHDFWVPGMSAARVLNYTYEKLSGAPYLGADEAHRNKWEAHFAAVPADRRPRIGLRFYGNPKFEHEQHRRFPKEHLIGALGSRPWVNLQKEESDLDLSTWDDTLAVISHLDLVITSCTSVAHAAAALGKETWILLPVLPYYIWALPGDRSPWYRSVKLFRQKKFGDWKNVFEDISAALEAR